MSYFDKVINGYRFQGEENGTVKVTGVMQDVAAERSGNPACADLSEGYQKGHVMAAASNGPTVPENIRAQAAELNQGAFKSLEMTERSLIRKQGATIETERIAYCSTAGRKPDAFMVNDKITYPDGTQVTHNLSFANLSGADQEAFSKALEEMDETNPEVYATSCPEGMRLEEYNRLMDDIGDSTDTVRQTLEGDWQAKAENDYDIDYDFDSGLEFAYEEDDA